MSATQLASMASAANLLSARLLAAKQCRSRNEVLDHALDWLPNEGLVCEFGVFEGESANYLARRLQHRQIFGFDSFEGLPEAWRPDFEAGMFSTGGSLPSVEPNVTLIKGWFDATVPSFADQHTGPAAMLHIDCDLYSSTKCVLNHLGDRLGAGAILVFDEFFNYPGWEEHEFRAFSEFVHAKSLAYECLAYNVEHEQVAIRVTGYVEQ